jgi:hypothetical protein
MTTFKNRTLSYRRADWLIEPSMTLCGLVVDVLGGFPDVPSTSIVRPDGTVWDIRHRRVGDNQVHLHIASHNPGEEASTVTKDAKEEGDLQRAPAPPGQDYLDGDAMMLINGDDVIVCVSDVSEPAVTAYLRDLMEKGGRSESNNFELRRTANPATLRTLVRDGVKSVNLNVSAFSATLPLAFNDSVTVADRIRAGLNAALSTLIGGDRSPADLEREANLQTFIELKARGNNELGLAAAARTAENVLDSFQEGYEIVTRTGVRITPSEISVREQARFAANGTTVDHGDVWDHMDGFFARLLDADINAQ